MTFTVKVSGLNGSLSLASNNGKYTVSPSTITKAQAASGCTVTVTYEPTTVGSTDNGTITISGGGAENKTVSLTGKCVAGYITVTPNPLDFGTLTPGKSLTKSFTVTTNVPGTLSSTYGDSGTGGFENIPSVTQGGTYSITFHPNQAGNYGGFINISDSKHVASARFAFEGKCVKPTITVNPESIWCGSVPYGDGSHSTKTFTVTGSNLTGSLAVKSSDKTIFSVSPTTITADQAAAGATVTVTYTPSTIHVGNKTDTGEITVSGGGAEDKKVNVSGRGINAGQY